LGAAARGLAARWASRFWASPAAGGDAALADKGEPIVVAEPASPAARRSRLAKNVAARAAGLARPCDHNSLTWAARRTVLSFRRPIESTCGGASTRSIRASSLSRCVFERHRRARHRRSAPLISRRAPTSGGPRRATRQISSGSASDSLLASLCARQGVGDGADFWRATAARLSGARERDLHGQSVGRGKDGTGDARYLSASRRGRLVMRRLLPGARRVPLWPRAASALARFFAKIIARSGNAETGSLTCAAWRTRGTWRRSRATWCWRPRWCASGARRQGPGGAGTEARG